MKENNRFLDKFSTIAMKIGGQIHMMSLRDTFATISPLFILAGISILLNFVLFPFFFKGEMLVQVQRWGTAITHGTLNLASLLVAIILGYTLAKYRHFANHISAVCVSVVSFIVVMPEQIQILPVNSEKTILASGALSYEHLGTKGILAAVLVTIVSVELFIRLSQVKRLKINLGEGVPPQVAATFNVMIPSILVISLLGVLSVVLNGVLNTDLVTLIAKLIQQPLQKLSTGPLTYIFLTGVGNLFFSFGIHQSAITGALVDPFLIGNMNENMLAFSKGLPIPHIINSSFGSIFGMIGGSGNTFSLLIAIFVFSRVKAYRAIGKISILPGIFTINEPIIFGIPIVFNLPMIIPFVLVPTMGIGLAYICTMLGLVSKCVVMIPWITPPIIGPYMATAGDIRAVILQIVIILLGVVIYLPFMKLSEQIMMKNNELSQK